jgi:four helix bundle protein
MRDHKKLRAFQLADDLAIAVYGATKTFPRDERFGLTSQIRRSAVSTASNIVEGCARDSQADYIRFLDIAHGSAHELEYQLSLAHRLSFLDNEKAQPVSALAVDTCKVLNALIRSLRGA